MVQPDARSACRELAEAVLHQVREYRRHGYEIVGLVGINESPTCGVEATWYDDQERDGPGVFVETLQAELYHLDIAIRMRGIKAYQPAEAVRAVGDLLARVPTPR
jgi:predicted secreted protein